MAELNHDKINFVRDGEGPKIMNKNYFKFEQRAHTKLFTFEQMAV